MFLQKIKRASSTFSKKHLVIANKVFIFVAIFII